MSYTLVHRDGLADLFARSPLVPAAELARVGEAVDLLAEAGRLHAATAERVAAAEARGRAAGHAEGLAEGRAEAERAQAAWLFDAHLANARARAAARAEMAGIVVGALRRIAGAVAPEALVAGLAERAVADLAPDSRLTVRVAPANAVHVRAHLHTLPAVVVDEDSGLGPTDCVIDTPAGRVLGSLDIQLQTLARRWARLGEAPDGEAADG
jgi:flagellar biosynthesis/type III secretory pathway protein FliH